MTEQQEQPTVLEEPQPVVEEAKDPVVIVTPEEDKKAKRATESCPRIEKETEARERT